MNSLILLLATSVPGSDPCPKDFARVLKQEVRESVEINVVAGMAPCEFKGMRQGPGIPQVCITMGGREIRAREITIRDADTVHQYTALPKDSNGKYCYQISGHTTGAAWCFFIEADFGRPAK
jgi:hypothetical protein